jgi:FRG domain
MPTEEEKFCDLKGFEERVQQLQQNAGRQPMYFRGHADSSWKLETTLQRFSKKTYTIETYAAALWRLRFDFAGLSQRARIPSWGEIKSFDQMTASAEFSEFLFRLRHLEFPSPVLDWSQSPYVALFFAYDGVSNDRLDGNSEVAVYVLAPGAPLDTSWFKGQSRVAFWNPGIVTNERHHIQKSSYTLALKEGRDNSWEYHDHEADEGGYHHFTKLILPAKLRDEMLERLDQMLVTKFSLYRSPECLARTLAQRHLRAMQQGFRVTPIHPSPRPSLHQSRCQVRVRCASRDVPGCRGNGFGCTVQRLRFSSLLWRVEP